MRMCWDIPNSACPQQIHHLTSLCRIFIIQDKHKKAVGPYSITNSLLHDLASGLAPSIYAIWNSSFCDRVLSKRWKSVDVFLLPKLNPLLTVYKDLRPISLTTIPLKCTEWYAREWVMQKSLIWYINISLIDLTLVDPVHNWLSASNESGPVVSHVARTQTSF